MGGDTVLLLFIHCQLMIRFCEWVLCWSLFCGVVLDVFCSFLNNLLKKREMFALIVLWLSVL